jgi:hypothetical protein
MPGLTFEVSGFAVSSVLRNQPQKSKRPRKGPFHLGSRYIAALLFARPGPGLLLISNALEITKSGVWLTPQVAFSNALEIGFWMAWFIWRAASW